MDKLQETIECIERKHKSHIELACLSCEVYSDDAHFCIGFSLANGDCEKITMKIIYGEDMTYDDERLIEEFNDFVDKSSEILTTYYNIDCDITGSYYI